MRDYYEVIYLPHGDSRRAPTHRVVTYRGGRPTTVANVVGDAAAQRECDRCEALGLTRKRNADAARGRAAAKVVPLE